MLRECQKRWDATGAGVTSYKSLLDTIRHHRKPEGRVCLVTFNYDTMLEDALSEMRVQLSSEMSSYIADDVCKVFKVHGSVNWAPRWQRHSITCGPATLRAPPIK